MDGLTLGLLILAVGMTNFLLRGSFLLVLKNVTLPHVVQRALRYVPVAAFAALVVPELALTGGSLNLQVSNPKLIAGLAAAVVAWRTRNTLVTIGVGMVMLHVTRGVFPT